MKNKIFSEEFSIFRKQIPFRLVSQLPVKSINFLSQAETG